MKSDSSAEMLQLTDYYFLQQFFCLWEHVIRFSTTSHERFPCNNLDLFFATHTFPSVTVLQWIYLGEKLFRFHEHIWVKRQWRH